MVNMKNPRIENLPLAHIPLVVTGKIKIGIEGVGTKIKREQNTIKVWRDDQCESFPNAYIAEGKMFREGERYLKMIQGSDTHDVIETEEMTPVGAISVCGIKMPFF